MILDGALKVFAQNGFHDSKVTKIAEEAGVASGTIYLYFKNKQDILISVFRKHLGILIENCEAAIQEASNAEEAIEKICVNHYSSLEDNEDLAFLTQIEMRQSSLELRKAIGQTFKPYIQLIERVLQQGIDEGIFNPDMNVKLTRLLVLGAMDEVVTSWLIAGGKYKLRDQIAGTVNFILNGIK